MKRFKLDILLNVIIILILSCFILFAISPILNKHFYKWTEQFSGYYKKDLAAVICSYTLENKSLIELQSILNSEYTEYEIINEKFTFKINDVQDVGSIYSYSYM